MHTNGDDDLLDGSFEGARRRYQAWTKSARHGATNKGGRQMCRGPALTSRVTGSGVSRWDRSSLAIRRRYFHAAPVSVHSAVARPSTAERLVALPPNEGRDCRDLRHFNGSCTCLPTRPSVGCRFPAFATQRQQSRRWALSGLLRTGVDRPFGIRVLREGDRSPPLAMLLVRLQVGHGCVHARLKLAMIC